MTSVIKLFRITCGFICIVIGLILAIPGVPGPGLAIAAVGLAILSKHFAWARHTIEWGKAKLEAIPFVRDWLRKRREKNTESSAPERG